MMDVRKLLAKLNPRSPQYTVGNGGVPEFTPQDIAAALGMVRDAFGRELLCHVWWPDGAAVTAVQLLDAMRDMQLAEWISRMRRLEAAQLAEHLAAEDADGTHGRMAGTVHRSRGELAGAKAECWPRIGPQSLYLKIRMCVLAELSDPHLCQTCKGRGSMRVDARLIVCPACRASGRLSVSDRQRAAALARDESSYRSSWKNPYEWLIARCAESERTAGAQLADALGLRD